jgi:hypothetical protein
MVAVTKMTHDAKTREYAEKRRAQGRTNKKYAAASSATSHAISTARSTPQQRQHKRLWLWQRDSEPSRESCRLFVGGVVG